MALATRITAKYQVTLPRQVRKLMKARITAVSTSILLGELRYAYLREDKPGFEVALAAIRENTRLVDVTISLAIHAAELRKKYSSRKTAFSYNDGLYLATAITEKATLLVTTAPHFLTASEVKAITPKEFK